MTRYSHAFTFAFEIESNERDGSDLTGAELRAALLERIYRLSDEEILDACDAPYDTYEVTR